VCGSSTTWYGMKCFLFVLFCLLTALSHMHVYSLRTWAILSVVAPPPMSKDIFDTALDKYLKLHVFQFLDRRSMVKVS
jgi:hypothetical protein